MKAPAPGEIVMLMSRALRQFEAQLAAKLAERGFGDLHPAHLAVLRNLTPGGTRITDIARRAGLTKQAIGLLVTDLEKRGVLRRVPDATDGRAKLVRMTPAVAARNAEVLEIIRALDREHARRLGAGELAVLMRLLRALVA